MHLDEIFEELRKDLAPWVKKENGELSVSKDPWNTLELLSAAPQGIRVVLGWGGDDPEGDIDQEPLGNNIIELSVGYNLGLAANRDEAISRNTANRPSLMKLVSAARARLLAYVFAIDGETQFLQYAGTQPVTLPDGMPLAAYRIRVRILTKVEVDEKYRGPGAALMGQ